MIQEGPDSHGHGAHVAPEQCRAGADVIPLLKTQGRDNSYAVVKEGPESYGHEAHMAPEQCRAGADIIPLQCLKDALTFMT